MDNKKKNAGLAIIVLGGVILANAVANIDFDQIRKVDIVRLTATLVFISCGIFALIKSRRNAKTDQQ